MEFIDLLGRVPDPIWGWGPGIVIVAFVYVIARQLLGTISRLGQTALAQFLGAQEKQADAISKLAVCIEGQTAKNDSMQDRILVGIQVLHQDVESLRERLEEKA
jgi:hypothetical protein